MINVKLREHMTYNIVRFFEFSTVFSTRVEKLLILRKGFEKVHYN